MHSFLDSGERQFPHLLHRFVFMTGGTTSEAAEAFLAAIPNEKLHKPFTVQELRGVVARALEARPLPAMDSA